ncbi:DMSO/TMAO reductase YedYZ molybdopterin-dependent catalytic subunit [Mycobacterium frederiksbergense]|uniref:DMSO/TMAO reductase YedYZ molybdopterin-dependent catalytic subunit n=1 Tax=Mycolicibacterium frederiksbergense TaxID=117567 RepID=A0ABT6L469_9MYCO|nr:molybdopterin-dependent oxidoreductase [Mycolicibacterium frederiksbergense]MDH6197110.1 DMSO/TMAO reductase YedYZ molybdopterin-dependent catalytic subunit [Mycolicibacterium frederiksbergense]
MTDRARHTPVLAGIAAAAVALGVTELLAVFFGPAADARTAVGSAVIDLTPGPVREWAITTFGTADKLVLSVLVLAVIAGIAAVAATWETRKVPVGSIAIGLGGVLGCAAVLSRAGATWWAVLPTVAGTFCGIAALRQLVSERVPDAPEAVDNGADPGRRRSLLALGLLIAGAVTGVTGAVLSRMAASVAGERDAVVLPRPPAPTPPAPPAVQPDGVALPPFVTPASEFYRIDTALSVPQVSRDTWQVRIHGMTDRDVTLQWTDLDRFEVIEKMVTLTCVSNPVGGDLISNATWTGYRLRDLLSAAGIHPDADMVLSTSVDGFTVGTPTDALTDDRDALLAIGMNGQPLPTEHGYPARLVVPGLYGYVSATKWVVDLELTRFDRAEAYWTKLGWSARAPIKTESRVDVPRNGQQVSIGPVRFGGVAWAQPRGVRGVEVRIDDPGGQGDWQPAQLGASYSNDTWRLWSFDWNAANPGQHTITVRATDNTGAVQTSERADPVPDGATGWHSVSFDVA